MTEHDHHKCPWCGGDLVLAVGSVNDRGKLYCAFDDSLWSIEYIESRMHTNTRDKP